MLVASTATTAASKLEYLYLRSFMSQEPPSLCSEANWSQSPGKPLLRHDLRVMSRGVYFDVRDRDLLSIGISRLDEPARIPPTFH